jgi:acetyl esterase/lipase
MICILGWALSVGYACADATVRRNISYGGPNESQAGRALDVYFDAAGKNRPVMIFIHGGGWQRGDKANAGLKPKAFVAQGFVYVTTNYRFVPAVDYKQQVGDVARAIRYVHDHATEWRGSPEKIYLMGHSAGAHLAALVATDERRLKDEELSLDAVSGVVLLDGAGYDIPRHVQTAGPIARGLYERVFGEDPKVQADASPIHHVAGDKKIPPFLIIHVAGRRDSKVQSHSLADAIIKAGGSAKVVAAEGKTHGSLNQDLGRPGDDPTQQVFDFLKSNSTSAAR